MRQSEFNNKLPRPGDAREHLHSVSGRVNTMRGRLHTILARLNTPLARLGTGPRLALTLAVVIVLYAVYKLVLCDPHFLEDTSRSFRHFIKFGIVLLVYGLGVVAFYRNSQGWVLSVWHFLYLGLLVLLTLLGVFDAVGGGLPLPIRGLTTTLFEFLISPVPLVVLVVVSRVMEMAAD